MAPIDWSWGESYAGPTFTMMPLHPSHFNTSDPSTVNDTTVQRNASQISFAAPQWNPQGRPAESHTSRKRSRDDAGWDEDDASSHSSTAPFPSSRPTPSPPRRDPLVAPGTTLICPQTQSTVASLQTGIWAEELSERLRSSDLAHDEAKSRPRMESRKSIRLDRSEGGDDVEPAQSCGTARRASVQDPAIDEATRTLGMSWSSIASTPTMDAASRGWARHIETHFPLQSVKIVWKNSSLPAYLISAVTCDGRQRGGSPAISAGSKVVSPWHRPVGSPGYFLFDQEMTQGRMIAKSWGQTLENLRAVPTIFEGEKVMDADADEAQRFSEGSNMQHWAGLRSNSTHAPIQIAVPSTEPAADGMDVD